MGDTVDKQVMILSNSGAKLILKYKTNLHTYMVEGCGF